MNQSKNEIVFDFAYPNRVGRSRDRRNAKTSFSAGMSGVGAAIVSELPALGYQVRALAQAMITRQGPFEFHPFGVNAEGGTCGEFLAMVIASRCETRFESRGITLPANLFYKRVLLAM